MLKRSLLLCCDNRLQFFLQHLGKMNSRVREDEKHEMIIRKLLKNTENKRCINCGSLVSLISSSYMGFECETFEFSSIMLGSFAVVHCLRVRGS